MALNGPASSLARQFNKSRARLRIYPGGLLQAAEEIGPDDEDVLIDKIMADNGKNIHKKNRYNSTLLDILIQGGHGRAVSAALDKGADGFAVNRFNMPPLVEAAYFANPAAMRALVAHGIFAAMTDHDGNNTFGRILTAVPPDVVKDMPDLQARRLFCLEILLQNGAEPDFEAKQQLFLGHRHLAQLVPDVQKAVELDEACKTRNLPAMLEVVARGVHPDANAVYGGFPPLGWAVIQGDAGAVKTLIDAGANVNQVFPGGLTPLHYAAVHKHKEVFKLLVEAGASGAAKTAADNPAYPGKTVQEIAGNNPNTPDFDDFARSLLAQQELNNLAGNPQMAIQKPLAVNRQPVRFKAPSA